MEDKTTIGISDAFREFIEALVEEVVLEGKPFEEQENWLYRYSKAEGRDYNTLLDNIIEFFVVMEEWKQHRSKSSELMAKMLAKECYISESEIEKLFSTPSKAKNQNMLNGHEYVDLGLPSGTLWATCNLGATKPEEYGDYFAWGETCPKSVYNDDSYKYFDGLDPTSRTFRKIKYTGNDGLKVLQPKDDAATTNWGTGWRMPTKEEWEELLDNTTHRWTKQNSVNGRLFTANNGNNLFLPAPGLRINSFLTEAGNVGCYWSSSLDTVHPDYPRLLDITSNYSRLNPHTQVLRSVGISVRAVFEN